MAASGKGSGRSSDQTSGQTAGDHRDQTTATKGRVDPVSGKKIVYRIEDGMDRSEIAATVYEMRNFYRQLGDGFFSPLDVMNFIQHHQIAKWAKPGTHLLDICCGRGLLLPLLRYQQPKLGSYTGVDIEAKNATYLTKRVTDGKPIDDPEDYYPFPVEFHHQNAAQMHHTLPRRYDLLVYTSSIEHMHPEMGRDSLVAARHVAKDGASLILTCPNTPEDQDGYQTQYRAHIYEWKRSELGDALADARWEIITEWGLMIDRKTLKTAAEPLGLLPLIERLEQFIPGEWLLPMLAPMFPAQAKEIGIVAKAV